MHATKFRSETSLYLRSTYLKTLPHFTKISKISDKFSKQYNAI